MSVLVLPSTTDGPLLDLPLELMVDALLLFSGLVTNAVSHGLPVTSPFYANRLN